MTESQQVETGGGYGTTHPNPVIRVLLAIRSSFLLFIATLGILLFLVGVVLYGGRGVLAAMFAIWGVSAVLYAGFGFLFLKVIGYQ
jgi:hypothetical protein